jgi:CRISPR-associated protein Cas2
MRLLLVYDISHDRTRTKIADICADYGLDRIQYSAFLGQLSRVHQEELMEKIENRLGDKEGKIQLFPICERDWDTRIEILPPTP